MISVTLEKVTKRFGEVKAVWDISLRIEKGELFFVLGPSGCGKSTLLRLVAGFFLPDGGRILFNDRDVSQTPPHKRNTGMVFQNYALWPHMDVYKNVEYGLTVRGIHPSERERRVRDALEMVQMGAYAERSPNQLSGGQQQRVALARALVIQPDAVLLDEPLSNLDAKLRFEMREQIRKLHCELGITMIYVTHDQKEALSMADRIAVIEAGKVVQIGEPRGLYDMPENRFVAGFIGETNFIAGRISKIGKPEHEGEGPEPGVRSPEPKSQSSGMEVEVETSVGRIISNCCPEALREGDSVICSIRPEALNLVSGNSEPGDNQISGTVEDIMYLGDIEHFFLKLDNGTSIKVVEACQDLTRTKVGDPASVTFNPRKVVVFAA